MTQVRSVSTAAYTFPTDRPEADGTLTWDSTTMVVVSAAAGSCLGLGWTYAPAAAGAVVRDLLADVVTGRHAHDVTGSWQAMVRAVRNAGRPGLVGMALSAVDIALWDLAGRLGDCSLPELWDASTRDVPVYGSGGFTSYDDDTTREQLGGWVAEGMPAVKIKIGESWGTRVERDLARAELACDVAGSEAAVFVDANGAYDVDLATAVGRHLDDLGVAWFEEPVSSDDLAGMAAVRDAVACDVAAGEYGWDLASLSRMLPSVDCLQIDVTRCGGYTEWRQVAEQASSYGRELSGHCAPYATLAVAATTPGLRHQEWFHDHVRIEQRFLDGTAPPSHGRLRPPSGPGHGLCFKTDDAAPFRVA